MDLRYEVSPSEAGVVVDGLKAHGLAASLENQALGQESAVVAIVGLDDSGEAEVRTLMVTLASTATQVTD